MKNLETLLYMISSFGKLLLFKHVADPGVLCKNNHTET